MLFGIIFVRRSFVISSDRFTQVDATHWVLDLAALVGPAFVDVRDVCLFVPDGGLLPPDAGLSLHVRAGAGDWEYRGCVSNATPSDVFPTAWPLGEGAPLSAHVGVTVEPLAELLNREATAVASRREYAKRVALDLFRFMESFPSSPRGDTLLVPSNVLELWLRKARATRRAARVRTSLPSKPVWHHGRVTWWCATTVSDMSMCCQRPPAWDDAVDLTLPADDADVVVGFLVLFVFAAATLTHILTTSCPRSLSRSLASTPTSSSEGQRPLPEPRPPLPPAQSIAAPSRA